MRTNDARIWAPDAPAGWCAMTPYDTTQPNSETANRSQGDQSLSG